MRLFLLTVMLAGLSACSQPMARVEAPEAQYRINTVSDWRRVAFSMTNKMLATMAQIEEIDPAEHEHSINNGMPPPRLGSREYYVHSQNTGAPFTKSFTPLLNDALGQNGAPVRRDARNAAVVNYAVETYYYGDGMVRRPIDSASLAGIATAVGIKSSDWSWTTGKAALGVAAAGPLLDALIAAGDITKAEAVLTLSVVSDERILYQDTEIMYVDPADLPFYWGSGATSLPLETADFCKNVVRARAFYILGE